MVLGYGLICLLRLYWWKMCLVFFFFIFSKMSSGAGSSGTGRGRGSSLADNKPENKEAKTNPKMSKALGTSAKR